MKSEGERRWRAAKLAGVKEIPVIIKKLTEQEIMEISLIENIQREDLNPTEEQLVQNWANILYDNNRGIDKLGNFPLTKSEMQQVIDQVNLCDSPYVVNKLINGQQISIKRDNGIHTNKRRRKLFGYRKSKTGVKCSSQN